MKMVLTVNMKCFEIFKAKDLFTMTDKLTVNMKCFEIYIRLKRYTKIYN